MVKKPDNSTEELMTSDQYFDFLKSTKDNNDNAKSSSFEFLGKKAMSLDDHERLFAGHDFIGRAEEKWAGGIDDYVLRVSSGCRVASIWKDDNGLYKVGKQKPSNKNGYCWKPRLWVKAVYKESENSTTQVTKGPVRTAESRLGFGHPTKELSLDRIVARTTAEATTVSLSRASTTASNWNYKFGIKISAKVFGIGTDMSHDYTVGGSTSSTATFSSGKTSTNTQNFVWDSSAFSPAGKKCDMYLKYQKVATRTKVKVYTQIENSAFKVDFYKNGKWTTNWLAKGPNTHDLWPKNIRKNKVYDIVHWDDEYYEFWIERKNCRNY